MEKLLGALKSTIDHMSSSISGSLSTTRSLNLNILESGSSSEGFSALSDRVESAVKSLGEMRSWMREDSKVRGKETDLNGIRLT